MGSILNNCQFAVRTSIKHTFKKKTVKRTRSVMISRDNAIQLLVQMYNKTWPKLPGVPL